MIVGNRKSLEDILEMIKPYKKVLLLGCNECVTVCASGGEREVGVLASEIKLWHAKEGREIEIREHTLERQCDHEYIDQIRPFVDEYEVILSMACGAGVQYVAEKFRTKPVLPAINTTFLGVTLEQGVWSERCQGCGTCILDQTGGSLSDRPVRKEPAQRSLRRVLQWEVRGRQGDRLRLAVDHRQAQGTEPVGPLRGDHPGQRLDDLPGWWTA